MESGVNSRVSYLSFRHISTFHSLPVPVRLFSFFFLFTFYHRRRARQKYKAIALELCLVTAKELNYFQHIIFTSDRASFDWEIKTAHGGEWGKKEEEKGFKRETGSLCSTKRVGLKGSLRLEKSQSFLKADGTFRPMLEGNTQKKARDRKKDPLVTLVPARPPLLAYSLVCHPISEPWRHRRPCWTSRYFGKGVTDNSRNHRNNKGSQWQVYIDEYFKT